MTKILIADDNEQNIYIMKVLLESNGYDLIMAKNGLEALEAAKTQKPNLIISDILMPGMDGFGLCRELKLDDELKKVPFIFYTATYTDAKDEEFALSLGAERFVRKPTEPNKFIMIVRDILKQHKEGKLVSSKKELEKEDIFYKKYNAALIRKMEDKMLELEMVNKRLTALFHTSVDLTSLMPGKELISAILSKVIEVIGCSYANYFMLNERKNILILQTIVGFPKKETKKYQRELTFKLGEERGLVGLVGKSQEPLVLDDTHADPRWIKVDKSIKSALFLPMVSEGHLIGVLSFFDTTLGKFDEKISRDLATLANNLAIAIEKTRFIEKIQQSENRYRTLVETSIDAIVSINKEGIITDWSRGAEEVFGYFKDEQIDKPIEVIVPKENQRAMAEVLKDVKKIGFRRKWETQMLAKDHKMVDVEMTFTYLGEDMGYTAILRDITNLRRSEQLLNALNQASQAIATALTPKEIFFSVAKELRKLKLKCMLFQLDNSSTNTFSTYIRCESNLPIAEDGKPNVNFGDFPLPIDAIEIFKKAIQDRRSIYSETTEDILKQISSEFADRVSKSFSQSMGTTKIIIAPLIADEKVIGIFTVQSDDLKQEDTPAVTAFANQLAGAWNKAKLTAKLKQTMDGTIQTIALIVEERDPYTSGHQNRVSDLAAAIAREMNLSNEQVEGVRIAGTIHDLGKMHIPTEILTKPGTLTKIEYELVKTHSQVGYDLLKNIDFPWPLAEIVHQHHEKINGSGYPRGLKGDDILLEAKIVIVADVVEAMSSHRPYRPALDIKLAKEEIMKNKGKLYDTKVVNACLKVLEQGYKLSVDK